MDVCVWAVKGVHLIHFWVMRCRSISEWRFEWVNCFVLHACIYRNLIGYWLCFYFLGKSLKTLMSKGILQVHPPICDCPGCRISSPVVSVQFSLLPYGFNVYFKHIDNLLYHFEGIVCSKMTIHSLVVSNLYGFQEMLATQSPFTFIASFFHTEKVSGNWDYV